MTLEIVHYSRCRMVPTPSSLAFQLGLLQKEVAVQKEVELRLEFGDYDHGGDRLWMRNAGNAKSIWLRSTGADTRLVAFSPYEAEEPIFTLPGSGIERPADLKGRRIALFRIKNRLFDVDRQVYLKPYLTCLASAGLTLADVQLVESEFGRQKIQGDAAPEPKNFFAEIAEYFTVQLLRGEVDAIATNLPPDVVDLFGLKKIYDSVSDPSTDARGEMRTLAVSGALMREHRDVVVGTVARLLETRDWATAHQEEVPALVAKDLNIGERALLCRQIDFTGWCQVDCTSTQIGLIEKRKNFMLSAGIIERDFSAADWVDTSIVRDARALLG